MQLCRMPRLTMNYCCLLLLSALMLHVQFDLFMFACNFVLFFIHFYLHKNSFFYCLLSILMLLSFLCLCELSIQQGEASALVLLFV